MVYIITKANFNSRQGPKKHGYSKFENKYITNLQSMVLLLAVFNQSVYL